MSIRSSLLAFALACTAGMAHARSPACGTPGNPCTVPLGSYHIMLPVKGAGPFPVVVHFHGAWGSGKQIVTTRWMMQRFLARGYAVIAPNGLFRKRLGGASWYFRSGEKHRRDELMFLRQVLKHARGRFPLDRRRTFLTGHSVGGSLVWYLACRAPKEFTAFAPVAGGFWRPHPKSCEGPASLLHTHGWRDGVVPLEGRSLRGGTLIQGDVLEGLQLWRTVNGCNTQAPGLVTIGARYWRRVWGRCASGEVLELVLHPGRHEVPRFWPDLAMDWFEKHKPGWKDVGR